MKTFNKFLFETSYMMTGKYSVIKYYKKFMETQWWDYESLVELQLRQLKRLLNFASEYVPYYKNLFKSINLEPKDIRSIADLKMLPVLTKEKIRENKTQIMPKNLYSLNYSHNSTGGSTGQPLKYFLSKEDISRGTALLYRGWGYGGYRFGDKVANIGGSSLVPSSKYRLHLRLTEILRNVKHLSSYGMDYKTQMQYLYSLNKFQPQFIRGYASSIYTLACFVRERSFRLKFQPIAVFTTSERLLERQRQVIREVFMADVFDTYGLNDGGVSAYECKQHLGMHIDMERAIMEVVDDDGNQVFEKPGRILATSLYNYAFPFIRYDTGDIGILTTQVCTCGRRLPLLKEVLGRTTDVLELRGKKIGSPVLTVLFGQCDIEYYQIIQVSDNALVLKIVKGSNYSSRDERFIKKSLISHLGPINIVFDYVPQIIPVEGNKHKFIVDRRQSI